MEADKDILSAAFGALSATGADNFRIELGHAEIYKALIEELGADEQTAESIRRLIENKSFAALGDALAPYGERPAAKALGAMPQLFGGVEVLDQVEALTGNVRVLGAVAYLRRLYQALDAAGYGSRIMIDLGLVHEMDYYTGVMFRGYIGGAGAAILSGGRYNSLCAKFGSDLPAGGFGIDVERIADSLQGAARPEAATRRDTVRIALTKGRLEKKTLALLKAAGYDISELEAGSRKLIFSLPDCGRRDRARQGGGRDHLCRARRVRHGRGRQGYDHGKGRQLLRDGRPRLWQVPLCAGDQKGQGCVRRLQDAGHCDQISGGHQGVFQQARTWTSRPSRSKARSSLRRCSSWRTRSWTSSRPARRSRKTASRSSRTSRPSPRV